MRIGIDARCLSLREMTGVSRYVLEIIKRWMVEYTQHEFFLLSSSPLLTPFHMPENWHIVDEKHLLCNRRLWGAFVLPHLIKKYHLDIFWSGNYTLPRKVNNVRYYVNVYDLSLLKIGGIGRCDTTLVLRWRVKPSCKRADAIITSSESSAKDIMELFHIQKEKIKVVYSGGMPHDTHMQQREYDSKNSIKKISKPFFLFLGTIEPRKNVPTIIRAFEKYLDRTGENDTLVLAGKPGWRPKAFQKAYSSCKYKDRIILTGYVSDAYKEWLLSNAVALLYPSLYEGFGIPIIEAFDHSLPVITSAVSSMPEAGGDAALYLQDPCDSSQLAELMMKVRFMSSDERRQWNNISEKQRSRFTWEDCARKTMKVLEAV